MKTKVWVTRTVANPHCRVEFREQGYIDGYVKVDSTTYAVVVFEETATKAPRFETVPLECLAPSGAFTMF